MTKRFITRGANCFRGNFSHGTLVEHEVTIKAIGAVGKKPGNDAGVYGSGYFALKGTGEAYIIFYKQVIIRFYNKTPGFI